MECSFQEFRFDKACPDKVAYVIFNVNEDAYEQVCKIHGKHLQLTTGAKIVPLPETVTSE